MATRTLTLTVGLKVTDNEAISALEALQAKMGLADRVRDLTREELWEIDVDADTAERALEVVGGLVKTTNLFANPNKHRYELSGSRERVGGPGESDAAGATGGHPAGATGGHPAGATGGHPAGLGADEVAILVADREETGGDSVLSAIRRIGVDDVVDVRRWTRWRVRLAQAPAREDPELLPLIRKIGVATGRHDGLLSNPHSQKSFAVLPWGEEKVLAA